MANKWIYNAETDSAIIEENTEEVVLYVNDVHPEVISKVVEMHNEEYSNRKIQTMLEGDERVTPDETEYIMEQVEAWDEVQQSQPAVTIAPTGDTTGNVVVIDAAVVMKLKEEGESPLVPVVERKKRGPNKPSTATTGKKKVSVENLEQSIEEQIKALQEKKALIAVLKNVPSIDIPEDLTTAGKKIMVALSIEYRQLVDKYAEIINEM